MVFRAVRTSWLNHLATLAEGGFQVQVAFEARVIARVKEEMDVRKEGMLGIKSGISGAFSRCERNEGVHFSRLSSWKLKQVSGMGGSGSVCTDHVRG